jgi:hypothetical protein
MIGQQHVLDVFRFDDQEAVQEQQASVGHVPAEQFWNENRKLILAYAPQKLDQAELRLDVSVLDKGVGRRRRCRVHACLLLQQYGAGATEVRRTVSAGTVAFWPIATLPQEFMSAMPESGQTRTDVNDPFRH